MVEFHLAKVIVAGSIPVLRSTQLDGSIEHRSPRPFYTPAGPVPSRRDTKGRVRKRPGRSGCRLQNTARVAQR